MLLWKLSEPKFDGYWSFICNQKLGGFLHLENQLCFIYSVLSDFAFAFSGNQVKNEKCFEHHPEKYRMIKKIKSRMISYDTQQKIMYFLWLQLCKFSFYRIIYENIKYLCRLNFRFSLFSQNFGAFLTVKKNSNISVFKIKVSVFKRTLPFQLNCQIRQGVFNFFLLNKMFSPFKSLIED